MPPALGGLCPRLAEPRWEVPRDVEEELDFVGDVACTSGFFFKMVFDEAARRNVTLHNEKAYIPFKRYPRREFHNFLVRVGPIIYPGAPGREFMRRFGQLGLRTILTTPIGKALVAATDWDLREMYKHVTAAYEFSRQERVLELIAVGDHHAHFQLQDVEFIDSYHVGTLESLMLAVDTPGKVLIDMLDDRFCELLCIW